MSGMSVTYDEVMANLKSAILSWSAIILKSVIGDPSAAFELVVVACIGVLKLLSIVWYVEYLIRDMAAPESMRAIFLHVPLLWDNP